MTDQPTVPDPVTGPMARFRWERAVREAPGLQRHHKAFLLLVGTYMNHDGTSARPRVLVLAGQFDYSRQRAFELFSECEQLGWLVTYTRPGKPSERRPATPRPRDPEDVTPPLPLPITRQTGPTGHPSDPSDGSTNGKYNPTYNPSDPSDGTRQTHLTGTPYPSDPSDPTEKKDPTDPPTAGGTPPPDPGRTAAPAAPRTDLLTAGYAVN